MKKVSLIFQELLKIFLIYLILFVWIRYFVRKLWLASLISLLSTLGLYALIFLLSKKKRLKFGLKLKEKEDAENMFLSLSFSANPMDFFNKLASSKHHDVTKHKNYLAIEYKLEKVKTLLYFDGSFAGLTIPRLCEIYAKLKKEKASKIVIACYEITDKNLLGFLHNFEEKFVILDRFQSYEKLYKLYGIYPEITKKYSNKKSLAFKDLFAYSLNKKRTKGYLLSALILILCGLFVRASLYYYLMASLLIILALISQFNTHFNLKNDEEII